MLSGCAGRDCTRTAHRVSAVFVPPFAAGSLPALRLPERLQNLLLGVTLSRHLRVLLIGIEDHVQAISSTYLWLSFAVLGQSQQKIDVQAPSGMLPRLKIIYSRPPHQ